MPVSSTSNGVRIAVRVQPRSSREAVLGVHDGAVKIALMAPPVEGEANAALVVFLAGVLRVSKKQVALVRGESSKQKLVCVVGVTEDQVRRALGLC